MVDLPPGSPPSASPTSLSPCFNVNTIYQNCTPVYINVNLHIFTNINCEGKVYELGDDQVQAFQLAEDVIAHSNMLAANNKEQWPRQDPPVIVCNPIQYVLKGVYMHCSPPLPPPPPPGTNPTPPTLIQLGDYSKLHQLFAINSQTELNIYVTDNEPGQSWTGIASAVGGKYGAITVEYESTFNHELGHILDLHHANGHTTDDVDFCPDTNPATHNWDKNCNGTLEYSEEFRLCWDYIEPDSNPDSNENGISDCQETAPCTPSPCCGNWAYQNNNLMLSTGAYQEAVSNCQVTRMLTELANEKCDYIAQIGGVAPPNAFITQTASDIANTESCSECLILSASFNDVAHCLYIYKGTGNTLVYTTGWKNEPAANFCYSVGRNVLSSVLDPNTKYTALLTVRNSAGVEHSTTYEFITPSGKCELDPFPPVEAKMIVSPNPGNGTIQVTFPGHSGSAYLLKAVHQMTGTVHVFNNNYLAVEGENTVTVNSSELSAGYWLFELSGNDTLVQTLFLKL